MKQIKFLVLPPIWLLLFGISLLYQCQSPSKQETSLSLDIKAPPNVILILTDDQGYGDLSIHGNPYFQTPHLDTFAQRGVRLDRFFVMPLCAPTRASLLTGKYNQRTGARWVSSGLENMRGQEFTLAEMFKGEGYATACFGKWHNGRHYPFYPTQQGFDEFIGFCAGHWNNYFNTTLEHNGEAYPTEGYINDVLTNEALNFMEKNKAQPFFCYLPFNTPHSPFQVPDQYFDKHYQNLSHVTNEKERNKLACVYGMCENIDDNVGKILNKLNELSIRENTIVIFLSDNGPNGQRYNDYMRGIKGSAHEGGVRVPCFIQWPGHLPEGLKVETIAAHFDWLPTLANLCQIQIPDTLSLDGQDISPLLLGDADNWPERIIYVQQSGQSLTPYRGGLRTPQYRLVVGKDQTSLFDMLADPEQKNDLSKTNPELLDSLQAQYQTWYQNMQAQVQDETIIPLGFPNQKVVELPAHESKFQGEIQFKEGHGWAHDWVVNWTKPNDQITWEVMVKEENTFQVEMIYTVPETDLGSEIQFRGGGASTQQILNKAFDPPLIPSPDRISRQEVYEKTWANLSLGEITLPPGQHTLSLSASNIPGAQVAELKAIRLIKK